MSTSPAPAASQQTSTETREREIALVRSLAGLRDDDLVEVQIGRVGAPLSDVEQRRIGRDLGTFLATLHATDPNDFDVVSVDDEISQVTRKFDGSRDAIESEFTRSEWNRLVEFFSTRLPETMRALGSEPRVCHGDLGPYNLILGDAGRVGVIDFGDVGVFDESKDFMGLEATMLEAALDAYGGSDALRAKVEIRRLALPILDLPFYLGTGDAVGVAGCIERLRSSLR